MKHSEMFTFIKGNKEWTTIKTLWHDLNYCIKIEDDAVYLFFQESNGKKDWKDNLNFIPIPCKVYKKQKGWLFCHRGFVREYKSGNDRIMTEFATAVLQTKKKAIISGWSNGAAMAVLAAEDFYFRTKIKPEVISFGAPKVCLDPFSAIHIKHACSSVTEYCNKNDIVTKVPPFFWHVHKRKIDKKKLFGIFDPWNYHTHYDEVLKGMGL